MFASLCNYKDNELKNMIKELESISKIDKIDKILENIRKYIDVGKTEKEIFGEVFTPFFIIKEMLDKLDDSVWSDKTKKWLFPSNGIGNYAVVVMQRLMDGLKNVIVDDELRYKHILENMIYVCDIQPKNMFLWMVFVDPKNEYKLNLFRGSFLSKEFDEHMKNVWKVDNFQICTENPPYNDSRGDNNASIDIYNLFVEKAVDICDNVLMITPSRWFIKSQLSKFRNNMINKYGLKLINHFEDATKIFGNSVEIKGGVSYFLIERNYIGDTYFNDKKVDLKSYDIIPNDLSVPTFSLIDKIKNLQNIQTLFNSKGHFKIKTNDIRFKIDSDIKCIVSKQKGNIKYVDSNVVNSNSKINKWKIMIPSASGKGGMTENFYNRIEIGEPSVVCSESFIFFDFDSEIEMNYFKSYLTTRFVSYLVGLRKIKQDVTSDIFKWVPMIPFDREWTDEQLFEYFNLTNDEIDLIKTK
jgi:site-specific DNA-methyltransferase (adenine-specific)